MRASRHQRTRAVVPLFVVALGLGPGAMLVVMPGPLAAQQPGVATGRITGTVTGETGQPLVGVQVVVTGTRLGAITGDNGRYTITGVAAGTYQVRATRIGYRPNVQAVTVSDGGTATADFALGAAPTQLTEQVVVGYTTQQRRDVSDAVASVNASDVQDQSVATVEEALRGRVPGVQIQSSGEPGRPAQVIIRGQNFFGNPTPLYVVDGMYLRENPNLNPDDIESIDVLKDASAAAQYGSQAANGVVVIRTKRGRQSDNNQVQLRSYYGTQDVPHRLDLMTAQQWAAVQKQAYVNAGQSVPSGIADAIAGNPAANTNWQDAVFRTGRIQDHNLSIGGGTPTASYLISGGVFDQQGSIITTDFRRYSLRVNSDAQRGRLTLGENVALSRANRQGLVNDFLTGYPLGQMVRMLPTIPVRDPNNPGGYGYGNGANPTFGTNPVGLLEMRPLTNRSNQVIGSAYGEYRILPYLRYRLNLGANYESYGESNFHSITQIRMGSPNQFAELTEVRNNFTSLLAENLLSFDNQFREGMHKLGAVAGYTEQTDNADDVSGYRRGFSDEQLRTLNAGGENGATNSGTQRKTVLQSWLARANYTLLDRYLITGSIRRDGSSRFGPNNRWGVFSAASLGWVVSEEGFFGAIPGLNRATFFKLRASTGTLGNQDIGDYAYVAAVSQNRLGYPFGKGNIQTGATTLNLANPDIKWQSNKMENAGFDLGLLRDRLTLTADLYRSTSSGLLVQAPLPWSIGTNDDPGRAPYVNAGSMRNTGAELGLTYHWTEAKDWGLNTTLSLTTTRNKVLSLGNGGQPLYDQTGIARTAVGHPMGSFYVVRTAGIFQSDSEAAAYVDDNGNRIQPNARAGDVKYVDTNGDGRINDQDRTYAGNGTPKLSGGLFTDGRWRSLDFTLNLRGARGFKIFNAMRYSLERTDDPSNHLKGFAPWTPENHSRTTPRALAAGADPNNNSRFNTDRYIEDGNFLRIQNLVIGYTLPTTVLSRVGLTTASQPRVYVNMQNLHTFTSYKGYDPETLGYGNPLGRGIDEGAVYPNVRTISFGVDLKI